MILVAFDRIILDSLATVLALISQTTWKDHRLPALFVLATLLRVQHLTVGPSNSSHVPSSLQEALKTKDRTTRLIVTS
jgi:hypothetical protein